MSPAHPPQPTLDRVRPAMVAGLAVSLFAHAGAMLVVGRVHAAAANAQAHELSPLPPDQSAAQEEPPIRLGMDIPNNASIAWLGVLENPVEADAPESEVDQAALTPVVGEQPSPASEPQPPIQPQEPETEQPPSEPTEPSEPVEQPPAETPPQSQIQPEARPEPSAEPEPALPVEMRPQPFPIETARAEPVLPPVNEPAEPAEPITPTEPAEPAQPDEPAGPTPAEPQIMGPPAPPDRPRPQAEPAEPRPSSRPSTRGNPGVEDQRAADAVKRRDARDLRTDLLGQPLQASGDLNFKTVRPTWSLQVRNAYNPRRNPVVEIHFGPDGRVALAEFVPQPDGTRGSGYEEVDQPLLNAIYRWTASGKAIDALDKDDENARVSVVIRFLLASAPRGD